MYVTTKRSAGGSSSDNWSQGGNHSTAFPLFFFFSLQESGHTPSNCKAKIVIGIDKSAPLCRDFSFFHIEKRQKLRKESSLAWIWPKKNAVWKKCIVVRLYGKRLSWSFMEKNCWWERFFWRKIFVVSSVLAWRPVNPWIKMHNEDIDLERYSIQSRKLASCQKHHIRLLVSFSVPQGWGCVSYFSSEAG